MTDEPDKIIADDLDVMKRDFGRWLAMLRQQAGYETQQDAADAVHISRTSMAKYETGVTLPSRETVPKLVKLLKGLVSEKEIMRRIGMGPLVIAPKGVQGFVFEDGVTYRVGEDGEIISSSNTNSELAAVNSKLDNLTQTIESMRRILEQINKP